MQEGFGSYRDGAIFIGVHAALFGALCLAAQRTQAFHLRLICEGLAIGYLVWFIAWAWIANIDFSKRVLLSLASIAAVLLSMKTVLASGFASWFENVVFG